LVQRGDGVDDHDLLARATPRRSAANARGCRSAANASAPIIPRESAEMDDVQKWQVRVVSSSGAVEQASGGDDGLGGSTRSSLVETLAFARTGAPSKRPSRRSRSLERAGRLFA
jgi:hypothetical protein